MVICIYAQSVNQTNFKPVPKRKIANLLLVKCVWFVWRVNVWYFIKRWAIDYECYLHADCIAEMFISKTKQNQTVSIIPKILRSSENA